MKYPAFSNISKIVSDFWIASALKTLCVHANCPVSSEAVLGTVHGAAA
jgi:hypothetical protein